MFEMQVSSISLVMAEPGPDARADDVLRVRIVVGLNADLVEKPDCSFCQKAGVPCEVYISSIIWLT